MLVPSRYPPCPCASFHSTPMSRIRAHAADDSTDPGRELTRPRMTGFRLVVYPPNDPPSQVLANAGLKIGRTAGPDMLALNDRRVSREHAAIARLREGRFELRDLESRNGVFVNGRRVSEVVLTAGDVIRIGDTLLAWEPGPHDSALSRPEVSVALAVAMLMGELAARSLSPVLITGPTGAGKSWLARYIAERSAHAKPFVDVNCAALPPSLIEAELFGAVKGAYTGADRDREGYFEAARGGTLFLDEVGTLPIDLQAKLLTVLDSGVFRRVGSPREVRTDVRIIAATNADLARAVREGALRQDLLFRLAADQIDMKPLHLRRADIVPALVGALGAEDHRAFTPEALEALLTAPWQGNLRELLHLARALKGLPQPIDYAALPPSLTKPIVERAHTPPEASARPGRDELVDPLARNGGNSAATARELGKFRMQVHRWIKMYRIERG